MKTLVTFLFLFLADTTFAQEVFLKIKSLKCKPIVELSLNGKKTYFILDTGADISVLHSRSAVRYGFELVKSYARFTAVGLSNHQNDMHRVKSAKLALDEMDIVADFYSTDMSHIVQAVRERTNYEIVGIIGSDLMRKYGFVIDYKMRMVKIYFD